MSLDRSQHLSTLARGLDVLTHINLVGAITVSELSKTLNLSRGTSHRILETLLAEGYLSLDPHSRRYGLTSQILRLAAGYDQASLVAGITQPLLLEFSNQYGWPFSFAVPAGTSMIIRVTSEYHSKLSLVRVPVGFTYPMLLASAGVAFLAFCDPVLQSQILSAIKLTNDPRQTLVHNPMGLAKILERTRRDKFCALDSPTGAEGGIGAPIIVGGRPIGGLLMRFIKSAVSPEKIDAEFGPLVVSLAERVSQACTAAGIVGLPG